MKLAVLLLFCSLSVAMAPVTFNGNVTLKGNATLPNVTSGGVVSTTFISAFGAGSFDDNSSGLKGMKITIGGANITVTDLGCISRSDDLDNSKTVGIYDSSCVLIASCSVDISAHDNTVHFGVLTPTILNASTSYFIVLNNPGFSLFRCGVVATHSSVATIPQDAWAASCGTLLGTVDSICGPVNFKYH